MACLVLYQTFARVARASSWRTIACGKKKNNKKNNHMHEGRASPSPHPHTQGTNIRRSSPHLQPPDATIHSNRNHIIGGLNADLLTCTCWQVLSLFFSSSFFWRLQGASGRSAVDLSSSRVAWRERWCVSLLFTAKCETCACWWSQVLASPLHPCWRCRQKNTRYGRYCNITSVRQSCYCI